MSIQPITFSPEDVSDLNLFSVDLRDYPPVTVAEGFVGGETMDVVGLVNGDILLSIGDRKFLIPILDIANQICIQLMAERIPA